MQSGRLSAKEMRKAGEIDGEVRAGEARILRQGRPKLAILLDGAKAKKEFVDISISFLNGMMGGHFGSR